MVMTLWLYGLELRLLHAHIYVCDIHIMYVNLQCYKKKTFFNYKIKIELQQQH